ncbi:MAG: ABC transporter substrate-binding protein [Chloroflexota bacterium]|nr:ABC transporter substrate-binding protein [Chloroflexota bacterium]
MAADFAPLWVAYEAGIFRKVGVGVQLKSLTGLAGPAALIAGDIQIDVTGGPSVLGPIANGADVAVVGTFVPVYPYKLEVPPSIKRKEDLVGKKIGITSFGTASDVAARAALQKIGLAPDKDVSIVQVGSTAARLAALEKGEIQGTVGEPVDTVVLEAQGFHPLFDLAALNLPAAQGVIAARRSWLSANRGAMQAFMDAWVGATALMKKDRKLTTGVLTKYLKKGNRQAVEASYDYFVGHVFPLRPLPKAEQFADAIYWLGKRDRKIAALDAHKFIDASFVENVSSAAAR